MERLLGKYILSKINKLFISCYAFQAFYPAFGAPLDKEQQPEFSVNPCIRFLDESVIINQNSIFRASSREELDALEEELDQYDFKINTYFNQHKQEYDLAIETKEKEPLPLRVNFVSKDGVLKNGKENSKPLLTKQRNFAPASKTWNDLIFSNNGKITIFKSSWIHSASKSENSKKH